MSARLFALAAVATVLTSAGCAEVERAAANMGGNLSGSVQASWDRTAVDHRGQIGARFAYVCPPGGTAHSVWGSGVYSDDSSVCTAGVHAGAISFAQGGNVVIEMRPGQDSYGESSRNGVNTMSYGAWTGSYTVVNGN
jgi:hypothetical protein